MTKESTRETASQYLATMRKTLRFAEVGFGVLCTEYQKQKDYFDHSTEMQIVDPNCPTFEGVNCNYTINFDFRDNREEGLTKGQFNGCFVTDLDWQIFEIENLPLDAPIAPLSVADKNGTVFYERKNEDGKYTQKYRGEPGVHAYIVRTTLEEILAHQKRPASDIVTLADHAMVVLRPDDVAATFADRANRTRMQHPGQSGVVPARSRLEKFFLG